MQHEAAVIHVDGASRGNPGDAAYALVIRIGDRPPVEESGVLGKETNNVAEYTALIKALVKSHELHLRRLHIHSDSELLVKQMNGEYRVKNAELKSLYDEAKVLIEKFDNVRLTHVRREDNKRADELCNQALDGDKPKKPKAAPSSSSGKSKEAVGDGRIRDDCLECLVSAKACWSRGEPVPNAEQVWEQLWSIIEEGGVLRKK